MPSVNSIGTIYFRLPSSPDIMALQIWKKPCRLPLDMFENNFVTEEK